VAALALFLCGDDAAQITGANLSIDGGWTAEYGTLVMPRESGASNAPRLLSKKHCWGIVIPGHAKHEPGISRFRVRANARPGMTTWRHGPTPDRRSTRKRGRRRPGSS